MDNSHETDKEVAASEAPRHRRGIRKSLDLMSQDLAAVLDAGEREKPQTVELRAAPGVLAGLGAQTLELQANISALREELDATKAASTTEIEGLKAALAAAQENNTGKGTLVKLELIKRNPWQPRKKFDPNSLSELAENIKATGLLQPVVLRPCGDGSFELVAGERRFRAHQLIEAESIAAIFVDLTDEEMASLALVENIQREDLTDFEIGEAVARAQREFQLTYQRAAEYGLSKAKFYRVLSFFKLPEFVLNSLGETPNLMNAFTAETLVAALSKTGDVGVQALAEQWPAVCEGKLNMQNLLHAVEISIKRNANLGVPAAQREIKKIFVGAKQAGSLTVDASALVVRIKHNALKPEHEAEIRALLNRLFDVK